MDGSANCQYPFEYRLVYTNYPSGLNCQETIWVDGTRVTASAP